MTVSLPAKNYRLIWDGNSIPWGFNLPDRTRRYPVFLQAMMNQARFTSAGEGVPGIDTVTMTSDPYFVAQIGHPGHAGSFGVPPVTTVIVASELTNTIRNTVSSVAQTLATWAAYVAKCRAVGSCVVLATTCLPSVAFDASHEDIRLSVNVGMRQNPGGIYGTPIRTLTGVLDWTLIPETRDPTNLTWYSDGTHPTAALHRKIADFFFSQFLAAHIC
jgi:hypothetical protein